MIKKILIVLILVITSFLKFNIAYAGSDPTKADYYIEVSRGSGIVRLHHTDQIEKIIIDGQTFTREEGNIPKTYKFTVSKRFNITIIADTLPYTVTNSYVVRLDGSQFFEDKELEILKEELQEKTFDGLDKYDEDGYLIDYDVEEISIPEEYEKVTTKGENGETVITNKLKVCEYRIEYYYDGKIDNSKTFYGVADFGTTIEKYQEQVKEDYTFYKVENLGLKISLDEEQNVIKVYYISMPLTGGEGISNFILAGMILSILGFTCLAIFKNKQK